MKSIIKKILQRFGYSIRRTVETEVKYDNFVNLAKSYETRANETDFEIPSNDVRFELLARLLGTPPSEAYYIIDALAKTDGIPGSVCEFGVAQGETSALIANEILAGTRSFHLFDSFEGLPEPTSNDELKDDIFELGSMDAYTGTMSYPQQFLQARLNAVSFPQDRVVVHEGFIEEVIKEPTNLPEQVSFAYVDFDFYEPIKITLDFLHQASSKGSIIIVDDYDFFSSGVKTAVDEFVAVRNALHTTYECTVPDGVYGHFAVLLRTD